MHFESCINSDFVDTKNSMHWKQKEAFEENTVDDVFFNLKYLRSFRYWNILSIFYSFETFFHTQFIYTWNLNHFWKEVHQILHHIKWCIEFNSIYTIITQRNRNEYKVQSCTVYKERKISLKKGGTWLQPFCDLCRTPINLDPLWS